MRVVIKTYTKFYNIIEQYNLVLIAGLVGEPFNIETTSQFDTATITFKIDKSKLGDTEFDNLMFLWYDEENYEFVELETFYNYENSTVSIETTHFSRYMVVDKSLWFQAWSIEFNFRPTDEGYNYNHTYDTVLAIDCSGSMSSYDIIGEDSKRAQAATNFIDTMREGDRAGIVTFTSSATIACDLTDSETSLTNALTSIRSSGGTNFRMALSVALSVFDTDDTLPIKKRIILLSDGEDSVPYEILDRCKERNIVVYTIGLGSSSDSVLRTIATYTGGEFFKAYTAEELVTIYADIGITSDFDTTDTDGDGLLDGEEIDPTPLYSEKEDNGWLGIKKLLGTNTVQGYYFKMYTNPNKKDTDEDGLDDLLDNEPLNKAIHAFVIYETEKDEEYLHLVNTYDGDDQRRPEDFRYADLTEDKLCDMDHLYWGDFLDRNYLDNWKRLTKLLSMGDMQDVAIEMIDHFVDGTGTDFHSDILNSNVDDRENTKEYTDAVDSVFTSVLSEAGGELYLLKYNKSTRNDSLMVKKMQEAINSGNTDLYMPIYNDKLSGLGITVDGLTGNRIEVSSFKLEGNHYSGTLHYVMYDIYGLDSTDITDEYAAFFDFGILNGFRHWYILQHWDEFEGENRPFITYMEFDRDFEGDIS